MAEDNQLRILLMLIIKYILMKIFLLIYVTCLLYLLTVLPNIYKNSIHLIFSWHKLD